MTEIKTDDICFGCTQHPRLDESRYCRSCSDQIARDNAVYEQNHAKVRRLRIAGMILASAIALVFLFIDLSKSNSAGSTTTAKPAEQKR